MTDENGKIKLFDTHQVRAEWDAESEKWWFSIVDIVTILTESVDGTAYWRKLKQRLKAEGNETVTSCHGLKMRAADGNPQGLAESAEVAAEGAQTAKAARLLGREPHEGRAPVRRAGFARDEAASLEAVHHAGERPLGDEGPAAQFLECHSVRVPQRDHDVELRRREPREPDMGVGGPLERLVAAGQLADHRDDDCSGQGTG